MTCVGMPAQASVPMSLRLHGHKLPLPCPRLCSVGGVFEPHHIRNQSGVSQHQQFTEVPGNNSRVERCEYELGYAEPEAGEHRAYQSSPAHLCPCVVFQVHSAV